MNPTLGWALAVLAIGVGYWRYGWPGVLLGVTVVIFWLLLQVSRALRVMRQAGTAPVGRVRGAVMLQAKLKPGLRLIDVIGLTRSLGERVGGADSEPEVWRWRDGDGAALSLTFARGRLVRWQLDQTDDSLESPPSTGAM